MDERISKALAELRRVGISPLEFAIQTTSEHSYTNQEIADFVWEIAKQRTQGQGPEETFLTFSEIRWWLTRMVLGKTKPTYPEGCMGDFLSLSDYIPGHVGQIPGHVGQIPGHVGQIDHEAF